MLVCLGQSQESPEVFEIVIRELESEGTSSLRLGAPRQVAERSRDEFYAEDFEGLRGAIIENTEAQCRPHPKLIGSDARRVIEIVKAHGAV